MLKFLIVKRLITHDPADPKRHVEKMLVNLANVVTIEPDVYIGWSCLTLTDCEMRVEGDYEHFQKILTPLIINYGE